MNALARLLVQREAAPDLASSIDSGDFSL